MSDMGCMHVRTVFVLRITGPVIAVILVACQAG